MATALENLKTRRDAIAQELADGKTPAGESFRQPSASGDGESVGYDAYRASLIREYKDILELIANEDGWVEEICYGVA